MASALPRLTVQVRGPYGAEHAVLPQCPHSEDVLRTRPRHLLPRNSGTLSSTGSWGPSCPALLPGTSVRNITPQNSLCLTGQADGSCGDRGLGLGLKPQDRRGWVDRNSEAL